MSRRSELVLEILRERGPSRAEELGLELAARGGTRAKDPLAAAQDALRSGSGMVELFDGRWMALIWALDGVVLPHRVVPQERERSCLRLDPDLTVLAPLISGGALRSAVGTLRIVADGIRDPALHEQGVVPDRFLVLPYRAGRLLVPGTTVGVAIRGGTLEVLPSGVRAPASSEAIAVIEGVAGRLLDRPDRGDGRPCLVRIDDLFLEAAAIAPQLLRTLTEPIGDTLRGCGLATYRDLVGTPLTDWGWLDHDAAVWHLTARWDWVDSGRHDEPDPSSWSWADDTVVD